MKLRYALFALLLAPGLASAQTSAEAVFPELIITSPASIAATISNFVDYSTIPSPPYTIPDTTGNLPIIGTSVFQVIDATTGDTTSFGTTHTATGLTAPLSLALNANGELAVGCMSAADSTTDVANGADLVGTIAMVVRGVCPFYLKGRSAQRAGAVGFIVFNPSDRTPDTAINMAGGAPGDEFINIPGMFLPWDLAEAIFNEVAGGNTVNAIMRCDPRDPSLPASGCPTTVAAEGGPSADGAGLFFAGQNPTSSNARLVVRTPGAETVSVIAYNMLGQQVAVLHNGPVVGEQFVTLQGANLPSGSYFVRATGETFSHTQQVTIVR